MARRHKSTRLQEQTNRAAKMRAIDRKNLELRATQATHPEGNIRGFAVRWICGGASIGRDACLALRKLSEVAKREPRFVPRSPFANHGRKKIADDRHGEDDADGPVQKQAELHEHPTSRKSIRRSHRIPPRNRTLE